MAVVLYHIHHYMGEGAFGDNPNTLFCIFGEKFSYGAWFFFALSGFLMAFLIDTGYKFFLPRRLMRIYPTYIVVVAAILLGKALLFQSVTTPNLAWCMSLLPIGLTHGGKSMGYPLGVEWTLIFEVFFYFVCAIFAWGPMRRAFLPAVLLWAAAIVLSSLQVLAPVVLSDSETGLLPAWNHIPLNIFNLLFISGAVTYYLFKSAKPKSSRAILACSIGSVVAFTLSLWTLDLFMMCLLGLSFSLLIFAVCAWEQGGGGKEKRGLWWRLGDYSYAIYLVHVPIITVLLYSIHLLTGKPSGTVTGLLVLGVSLLAGWWFGIIDLALHRYCREQLDRVLKRLSPKPASRDRELQRA